MATIRRVAFWGLCLLVTVAFSLEYLSRISSFPSVLFALSNKLYIYNISNEIKKDFHKETSSFIRIQDVSSLETRFRNKTLTSCDNTRCSKHTHCDVKTFKEWIHLFESKSLDNVPLFSKTEYFFPWEMQYLITPPLEDVRTLPNLKLSKVYFRPDDVINHRKETEPSDWRKTVTLTENIPATFRVELWDSYGRPRALGGDEIRAWLKGKKDGAPPEVVWATAEAKDLRNGSYDVIVTPTWTGTAELQVALTFPREYIRLAIQHFRIGLHRFLFGKFKGEQAEEVTLCSGNPNIPGRDCLCNLTRINGVLFYCGRPLNSELSCQDFSGTHAYQKDLYKNVTLAEKHLDLNVFISRQKQPLLAQHANPIKIQKGEKDVSLQPCREVNRIKTWTHTSPRGFWSKDKTLWNSMICQEPHIDLDGIRRCLKSTTVWMTGDSNIRIMALHLTESLGCATKDVNKYPKNSTCRNEDYDITIHFRSHQHPLHVGDRWVNIIDNGAVEDMISSIPSTGDHILVLHYFIHFGADHLSVLLQRVRMLKGAVSKLLSRNPNVLVAIRGPHTAVKWTSFINFAADVLGVFIRQMYIETFRELQDKVVFLDTWDMSISFENREAHPNGAFQNATWRTLLAYKCD